VTTSLGRLGCAVATAAQLCVERTVARYARSLWRWRVNADTLGGLVTENIAYQPDVTELARCVASAADAMRLQRPDPAAAEAFVSALIHRSEPDGREVMVALDHGLITRVEARNLVIAHAATWLASLNGVEEPSYDTWGGADLEASFA